MRQIAIDGPSGAGKSTIAKALAERLGIIYLDTGAMYRALALRALRMGLDPSSESDALKTLSGAVITLNLREGQCAVLLNGEDVTRQIRQNEVSEAASAISAHGCVREYMVNLQRSAASGRDIVADGRDIGTKVLPHADYKYFLTAKAEERARRRQAELRERGEDIPFDRILQEIQTRDVRDMSREIDPLVRAEDAVLVDSTDLDIDEVLDFILKDMSTR